MIAAKNSAELQTPFNSFALLGSGRVARHLQNYIQRLGLPLQTWSRNGDLIFNSSRLEDPRARLDSVVSQCSHILFAVSDKAIATVARPFLGMGKTLVHFSGAAQIDGVYAAHPLMTFAPPLETLDWYKRIPFVIDQGVDFHELLPGLPNSFVEIAPSLRPLYHALASLAGNSSYLLWQNVAVEFEKSLGLPRHLLAPFLHQVVENATRSSADSLTGPVARGDWETVAQHIHVLSQTSLATPYRDFLNLAKNSGHQIPLEIL